MVGDCAAVECLLIVVCVCVCLTLGGNCVGTLACSPFHVRFGKFSLLRPYEKKV